MPRFPPPWSIEERQESFIVKYFEDDAAAAVVDEATIARRGIPHRGEHCQIAKRAAADIEGHSAAAELGQPERLSARVNDRRFAPNSGHSVAAQYRSRLAPN
jgi:hypothetical protein